MGYKLKHYYQIGDDLFVWRRHPTDAERHTASVRRLESENIYN